MTKKRKVNSTLPLWTDDIYRLPDVQAWQEGAPVSSSNAESNSRFNLANYTQIFATTVAASGTARAVMQSGGDPQAYQEVKQLIELMFDVEQQLVRNDQIGTQYGGQAGTATSAYGNTAQYTGRRMGSLSSFAGTQSFNTTSGNLVGISTNVNNASDDIANVTANTFTVNSNGTTFYTGTFTNQLFSPITYKQLVTTAEERYNAKIRTIVAPTSLRTMLSDTFPTSRTINRVNSERGDTIQTYEGDFSYTYEIFDSWIMDQAGVSNSIYFLNEEVLQWGSLRDLGPNNEVFSNADASFDQFIMEGTLIVRNPAGVGMLNNIAVAPAAVPTQARPSALVQRTNAGGGDTY